jgi:formate hydrogenlyase transcriptional activator
VGSKKDHAFSHEDEEILNQVAAQLAIALDNARAYREIEILKDRLAQEKLYLEEEIRTELNFEEIIGESAELKRVLSQARTVAPSGSTVLILGETGTGKELIARAIHRMSKRKDANFIKVNCAAIPTRLLESELFGHEKGAFTGAVSKKIGRMELADKGTLFLDEVGDIPVELQPKLLRVLQDHEFERLGSNLTVRVDLRLIAATNRDLSKQVSEGEFRSDLFYRLNVFPIHIPALRERRSDIPLLVRHFVKKLSRRMDKGIDSVSSATMEALVNWHCPAIFVNSRI